MALVEEREDRLEGAASLLQLLDEQVSQPLGASEVKTGEPAGDQEMNASSGP